MDIDLRPVKKLRESAAACSAGTARSLRNTSSGTSTPGTWSRM